MASKRIVIFGWADSVHIHRWASSLCERGYEVKVISLGGWEVEGCETAILPRKGRWSYLVQASTAVREALAFKPDLIHAHYLTGFGLWGLWSKFSPLLMSVWGADVVDFPNTWLRRKWIQYLLGKAAHITATSRFLLDTTLALRPDTDQKTTVIPFGVAVPNSYKAMPTGPPIKLCFIKAHRRKYGPDVLLQALARVVVEVPDITLSMAGKGVMTPGLKRMASDLGLGDRVDFVGFIPNDQMYSFLQQHHLMVMPSVMDSESFGVAVVETSACGRPVIASTVGGVGEVVRDGETGLLVPPDDPESLAQAIITLAQNADLMKKMGNAGHIFVRDNFSWNRSLDMMAELYERLIGEESRQ